MTDKITCEKCDWDGQGYYIPVVKLGFDLEKIDIDTIEKGIHLCVKCIFKMGASIIDD